MTNRRPSDLAFKVERDDVQSIALQAHTELREACYLFVRLPDSAPRLGAWLNGLAPALRTGAETPPAKTSALNVAFSHAGLARMALEERARLEFGVAFREGMSGAGHRSWDLGDVADSAPTHWRWGKRPDDVHAVLLLFAADATALDGLIGAQRKLAARCGVEVLDDGTALPLRGGWPTSESEGLREHFGFVDGISQPAFRLSAELSEADEELLARGELIAPGELLLGYPNESGALPTSPTVAATAAARAAGLAPTADGRHDLGRNGSYLVVRQIAQDVRRFWQFAQTHAAEVGSIEQCAAKLIGRWRNGAPLTICPEQPDLKLLDDRNAFSFAETDPAGYGCPAGAHMRRVNPRDALPGMPPRRSLAAVRRHRILRRGRPFGPPLAGWPDPEQMLAAPPEPGERDGFDDRRGMHFLCLNADIEQQFEFVQQRWINDPTFVNHRTDEVDPILGRHRDNPTFLVPRSPTPVELGRGQPPLARFTRVIGGAYFFLPSRRAVRYLAALAGG